MGRTDGFGKELLPDQRAFEAVLSQLTDCFTVRIGKGADLYPLKVSVDLNGGTSVSDLLDIGSVCDAVVGQCSFAIPLAEAFDKPALFVWAAHGMQYNMHPYIKAITPAKVLSKATSHYVMDDWTEERISDGVEKWRKIGEAEQRANAARPLITT
jgi:ADP-heptose:LPS heptosyltransferase